MSDHSFTGFGTPTQRFLKDLAANNNRDWFNDNKSRYEDHVVAPAFAFIEAMAPRLESITPYFLALTGKQGGSLMRIYRDTRFGHNRLPYKTNIGIHFRHEQAKDVHAPGFYVHIQPSTAPGDYGSTGPFIGVGIWRPPADALKMIRDRIADKPKDWLKARDDAWFRAAFELEGDTLKRPPRGFDAEHPCIEDLKRKDFVGTRPVKVTQTKSASFVDDCAQAFEAAGPFMRFLCQATSVPY